MSTKWRRGAQRIRARRATSVEPNLAVLTQGERAHDIRQRMGDAYGTVKKRDAWPHYIHADHSATYPEPVGKGIGQRCWWRRLRLLLANRVLPTKRDGVTELELHRGRRVKPRQVRLRAGRKSARA